MITQHDVTSYRWLWSDSPHSTIALGCTSRDMLRPGREKTGLLAADRMKPERPKEGAAACALQNCGHKAPRSAALFRQVSSRMSIDHSEDDAFSPLLNALRACRPAEGA